MDLEELSVGAATPPPLLCSASALFLDLDGTLAPFAERPQDVGPDARRNRLVDRLRTALNGRLAVVSGRAVEDIDRILEARVPAVAAVHGLVRRRPNGEMESIPAHSGLRAAAALFHDMAGQDERLLVEDKRQSIALHFRLAPERSDDARAAAERLARETGLKRQDGDMVVELRTPGPNKGDSVEAFMSAAPFAGFIPVFVGDDITDEDGFAAARKLGGFGVLVGPSRPTQARWRLEDVDQALAWLEAAL